MPAVEASSVSKSFGQQQIIAPLDLTIPKGEFVSLIGSSGCGKSTLLHLCAGLQEPTSGSIKIFGRTPAAACAAHEIGLACQRPALVPSRTALQNVQLTLTIAKPKQALQPAELLRHFGLDEALNLFPHQLSGGMQQRVNIACALVHEPSLLLLDEPFGALDELTRERLADWLAGVLRVAHRTAILVTHSVEEAVTLSDRIIVLSQRPATIADIVLVDLPNLRDFDVRQSDSFLGLVKRTREALHRAAAV
jgi:NitT/TauT family transport system ATP-binding protein